MRSLLLRVAALCLVILGLSHCGPDTVAVLVRVKNLPPGIAALASTVHLDCKPAQQSAEFTEKLDQLAVTVPKNAIVDGHLVIEVSALDSDRCEVSRGRIDTTVRPDNSYSEVEVSLVPLSKPLCTLTVEQTGSGVITPTPGGVVHGPAADPVCGFPSPADCSFPGACDFLKGQPVTLTSKRAGGGQFVTDWGAANPGQNYAASGIYSITPLTQPTKVHVRLSDGFCSPDNWCWSNPLPQGNGLRKVWGSGPNSVWVVGENGTILKWNGAAWSAQTSGTTQLLYGIWGSDANNIWAVGAGGTILKWDGSTWSPQTSGTTNTIYGVWGTPDAQNVWAVGDKGTILRWVSSKWTAQSSPTANGLFGIWGSDSSHLWAVGGAGAAGAVLKWDGVTWIAQALGGSPSLYGVWGSDSTHIWAVGLGGTILKGNGLSLIHI